METYQTCIWIFPNPDFRVLSCPYMGVCTPSPYSVLCVLTHLECPTLLQPWSAPEALPILPQYGFNHYCNAGKLVLKCHFWRHKLPEIELIQKNYHIHGYLQIAFKKAVTVTRKQVKLSSFLDKFSSCFPFKKSQSSSKNWQFLHLSWDCM